MTSSDTIVAGLRAVGIRDGSLILVHSSLSSFGQVGGGERTVIDALLTAVGPSGTVCMPTLTYGDFGPRRPPPPFDPVATPTAMGRIPEAFRQLPGVVRSVHPTHSMAAVGPASLSLIAGHEHAPTPCGPGSPWARVAAGGGVVVLLGVGLDRCTLFHGPEAEVEPDLRCHAAAPCVLLGPEGPRNVPIRLHRPYRGAVSRRLAMAPALESAGLVRTGEIAACAVTAIDAAGLWSLCVGRLRARPSRRVDRAEASFRAAARRALDRLPARG